ncbi:Zinc finger homeobox protein 2, partial [Ophiophagus hannah]
MEQTLEASPRLDPAQEDPALGLQPPEKEQHLPGSQAGDGPGPLAPAGREKADESGLPPPISAREQRLGPQLAAASQLSLVPLNVQAICPEQKVGEGA